MSVSALLIIASIACFLIAAFSVVPGFGGWAPLGLALFALAHLVDGGTRIG